MRIDTSVKAWVSKWCLTEGIREVMVSDEEAATHEYARVGYAILRFGRDIHLNRDAAVADANRRVAAKRASLEKQLAKLQFISFTKDSK